MPFLYFMIIIRPDQADPELNYRQMTFRACEKPPLKENWIYDIIYNQIINSPCNILFHLKVIYNERKPDIRTLKKERAYIL